MYYRCFVSVSIVAVCYVSNTSPAGDNAGNWKLHSYHELLNKYSCHCASEMPLRKEYMLSRFHNSDGLRFNCSWYRSWTNPTCRMLGELHMRRSVSVAIQWHDCDCSLLLDSRQFWFVWLMWLVLYFSLKFEATVRSWFPIDWFQVVRSSSGRSAERDKLLTLLTWSKKIFMIQVLAQKLTKSIAKSK